MKKTRNAHLWIGLVASIFIFMESLTGLLMNEPWLIGQQSQTQMRGNWQPGQFNQGQTNQGQFNRGQVNQGQGGQGVTPGGGQTQGQAGSAENGQFQGRSGVGNRNFVGGLRGEAMGQNSVMSTIRGLHEGRIGNTNIKWLIDLVAVAMMVLTGTGIYLSIKILRAQAMRKRSQSDDFDGFI